MDFTNFGANKVPLKKLRPDMSKNCLGLSSSEREKEETQRERPPLTTARVSGPYIPDPEKEFYPPNVSGTESQILRKARSVNINEILERSVSSLKSQMREYVDFFDALPISAPWTPEMIIEPLYQLVRSIEYDSVSILMLDYDNPGCFRQMLSRGYSNPPGDEITALFGSCVRKDGFSIDWFKLMELAEAGDNVLSSWILSEKINKIGYVPISDGERIMGVIIASNYESKASSPLASSLLELCGGRLGLMLSVSLKNRSLSELERRVRDLMGGLDMISSPGQLPGGDASEVLEKCRVSLNQANELLRKLKAPAS